MNDNKMIPENQSDFRRSYSTTSVLLNPIDNVIRALDKRMGVTIGWVDYSRAFHNAVVNLDRICEFSANRNLNINPSKSSTILFGSDSSDDYVKSNFTLRLGAELLTFSGFVKWLGVVIDDKLRFSDHLKNLIKKTMENEQEDETQHSFLQVNSDNCDENIIETEYSDVKTANNNLDTNDLLFIHINIRGLATNFKPLEVFIESLKKT